jgi:PmbA protein
VDIQSLSKLMLGLIEKSGADEGEVFIQGTDGLEIIVRDQTVERLRNKATAGYALRLIVDGRMSFVHSSDLRVASLESAIDKGVKLAKTASPDESNYLADPVEREVQVETYDGSAQEIPLKRKVNLLKDIETIAFAYDPCISKVESLHYDDAIVETVVTNTKGILKRDRSSQFSVSVSVVA